jgi:16S rRNA (adenine1518-N6/adenine1519-N6)-dimethyltransferase
MATYAGHTARRRFGQNFLVDAHYIARIVDAVAPNPAERLIEIGPGLGALTRALIERAGHVTAIEIDRDLAARLVGEFAAHALDVVVDDALAVDFARFGSDLRIVGNLPYNISSPLLFRLADCADTLRDAHVMLQREVVARMTAAPATADYGRLTVMLMSTFRIERLFLVPAGAFRPAPKVESAVARLVPLRADKPRIADPALFARLVTAAFAQRRKTLRNALSALCPPDVLARVDIDPGARGETLAIADFVRLANTLAARPQPV